MFVMPALGDTVTWFSVIDEAEATGLVVSVHLHPQHELLFGSHKVGCITVCRPDGRWEWLVPSQVREVVPAPTPVAT